MRPGSPRASMPGSGQFGIPCERMHWENFRTSSSPAAPSLAGSPAAPRTGVIDVAQRSAGSSGAGAGKRAGRPELGAADPELLARWPSGAVRRCPGRGSPALRATRMHREKAERTRRSPTAPEWRRAAGHRRMTRGPPLRATASMARRVAWQRRPRRWRGHDRLGRTLRLAALLLHRPSVRRSPRCREPRTGLASSTDDRSRTAIVRPLSSGRVHDVRVRVLVVEDHVALANRIADGLRDAGFAVDVVYDGEAAAAEHDRHRLRRDRARPRPADACTATGSVASWCATDRPAAS